MGARTLVVQACSGLPEMATPHPGITVTPASFSRLYVWYMRIRLPSCKLSIIFTHSERSLWRTKQEFSSQSRTVIAAIDGAFPLQESLHIQLLPAGRQLVTILNTSSFKYHFSTISCCLALPFRLAHYCVPGSSHTHLNIFNYPPYRRQMVRA